MNIPENVTFSATCAGVHAVHAWWDAGTLYGPPVPILAEWEEGAAPLAQGYHDTMSNSDYGRLPDLQSSSSDESDEWHTSTFADTNLFACPYPGVETRSK
jgi:hypothetical protein